MSSGNPYRADHGGGWCNHSILCRAANRRRDAPDTRFDLLGFRLALSAPGLAKYTDKKDDNKK